MSVDSSKMKRTFVDVDTNSLRKIVANKYCKSTLYSETTAVNAFNDFLVHKNESIVFQSMTKQQLNNSLKEFYASVRKRDSSMFKNGTLLTYRQSLYRYFKKHCNFDLLKDEAFGESNELFRCVLKENKKKGNGSITHYEIISDKDLEKVMHLDTEIPTTLQLLAWFHIQYHFCKRGIENTCDMKITDVKFLKTDTGKEFIQLADCYTKNHKENDMENSFGGRLYSVEGYSLCPVIVIKKYIAKLNKKNEYLWQFPKQTYLETEETWYENRKCGHNTIANFMKRISQFAILSKAYTNHCVRATSCTVLGRKFNDTDVLVVSGHKTINNLAIYKRSSEATRQKMSECLSESLGASTAAPVMQESKQQERVTMIQEDGMDDLLSKITANIETSQKGLHFNSPCLGKIMFNNCNISSINIIKQ